MSDSLRPSNRALDEMRAVSFDMNFTKHAEGCCLIKCGDTHVLCTASVETRVPPWLKGQGRGWVTAEYGMLPRSTNDRMNREAARGKQSGRTQEIQRLIGRSLRAVIDLKKLGEIQITVDCDVLQADGGTRTASITGGFIALKQAIQSLMDVNVITENPIVDSVSAISCGLYKGTPVLDLDYPEDSNAEADANFVLTGSGKIVEIQATAEDFAFDPEDFNKLMTLGLKGTAELSAMQEDVFKMLGVKAA